MRREAVAGAFYPDDPAQLRALIQACFLGPRGPHRRPAEGPKGPRRTRALVVPHAGYVYSGPIAARAYEHLSTEEPPPEVLFLGVDHRGRGAPFAVSAQPWRTPLGVVEPADELRRRLVQGPIVVDERSHAEEHSIEVQLPFLQTVAPGVPAAMLTVRFAAFDELAGVAEVVARAVAGRATLLVASTDFSHYVAPETARRLDGMAIAEIERRDPRGLYETVVGREISMCGIAPTTVLLAALAGETLTPVPFGWGHSGEEEPMAKVVGYSALAFVR